MAEPLSSINPATGQVIGRAPIRTAEQIREAVDRAREKGAQITGGGERLPGPGRFFAPTVIADATDEMSVMREETFGAVLAVQSVKDGAEAVAKTNASSMGLTAWTRNVGQGLRLARELRVGDVAINDHGASPGLAEIPWGGVKESGYGSWRDRWVVLTSLFRRADAPVPVEEKTT